MDVLQFGIFAALLQTAGYAFYGSKVLTRDIRPNAISWLMFAYGTTLLLVVEWDRDASFALLALPAACAALSIIVAFHALRNADVWWPRNFSERFSFGLDIVLTIVYLATWGFITWGLISEADKNLAEVVILFCWNIGVFTAFFPLLRQVYRHPHTEHAMPWLTWTFAYALLCFVTFAEVGEFNELMLYPLSNAAVHGFIAMRLFYWHIMRPRDQHSLA